MLTADEILSARMAQLTEAERIAVDRHKTIGDQLEALSHQLIAIRSAKEEIALLARRFEDASAPVLDLTQPTEKDN